MRSDDPVEVMVDPGSRVKVEVSKSTVPSPVMVEAPVTVAPEGLLARRRMVVPVAASKVAASIPIAELMVRSQEQELTMIPQKLRLLY